MKLSVQILENTLFFSFLTFLAFSSQTVHASSSPSVGEQVSLNRTRFEKLEEGKIIFGAPPGLTPPQPLKTGLFDLTYLGVLRSDEGGSPYFLFTGKPCQDCLEDRTVYAFRPTGGKPTAFVYPGKILEPRSRALLIESRAFFGQCLAHRGDVLVVFQKEKIDRRPQLQPSVMIAEAGKDFFSETLIERHLPNLATTLQLVKRKRCHEIEGRNRLMLNKPLDLHPHNDGSEIEEDDNEPEVIAP